MVWKKFEKILEIILNFSKLDLEKGRIIFFKVRPNSLLKTDGIKFSGVRITADLYST